MKTAMMGIKKFHFTKRNSLWSFICLIFFVSLGFYFYEYNIGPFGGDKISGLQDNHMRIISTTGGPDSLLFEYFGEYELNYEGKGIELYLDYYDHGQKEDSQLLTSILTEENHDFSGPLSWGLTRALESEESQFEDIYANLSLGYSSSNTRNRMNFSSEQFKGAFSYLTSENADEPLIENKPVMLWNYVEDGTIYETYKDILNGDQPKTNNKMAVIYILPK